MVKKRKTKEELINDFTQIYFNVVARKYLMSYKDIFALGYMCGKYDVSRLLNNQEEVIEACRKYDETDDLALLDTIGETLIDLEIITNEKGIL